MLRTTADGCENIEMTYNGTNELVQIESVGRRNQRFIRSVENRLTSTLSGRALLHRYQ